METPRMKLKLKKIALATLAPVALMASAHAATITISCGSVGQDFEFCKKTTAEWSAKTGNEV